MNKEEMIELLKTDVEGWNEYVHNHDEIIIDLQYADLKNAILDFANLQNSNLSGAFLNNADLLHADLKDANLYETNFQNADLTCAELNGANLNHANLREADLNDAHLEGANLNDATLRYAILYRAKLNGARLNEADLRDSEMQEANVQGAELKFSNLQACDLTAANLRDAILNSSDLRFTILNKANLQNTDLKNAILNNASLQEADLTGSCLLNTKLERTNFKGANLSDTDFRQADLRGATLSNAIMHNTLFMSRSQLNELQEPLNQTQLSNCNFIDERKFYKKQTERESRSATTSSSAISHDKNSLVYHYKDHTSWTPRDLSIFLMGIQSAYSNLLYLHTTSDEKLNHIENKLEQNSIYPPLEQEIRIQSIQSGSMLTEIGKLIQEASTLSDVQTVMITLSSLATISLPFAKSAKIVSEIFKTNSETRKNNAEADKIKAETEKIKAETALMLSQSSQATTQEKEKLLSFNDKNNEIKQAIQKIPFSNNVVAHNPELVMKATKHLQIAFLELAKAYKVDPEIIPPKFEKDSEE